MQMRTSKSAIAIHRLRRIGTAAAGKPGSVIVLGGGLAHHVLEIESAEAALLDLKSNDVGILNTDLGLSGISEDSSWRKPVECHPTSE